MGGAATGPRPGGSTGPWAPMSTPGLSVTSPPSFACVFCSHSVLTRAVTCPASTSLLSGAQCTTAQTWSVPSRQMSCRPSLVKRSTGGSKDPTVSQTPSLSPRCHTPVREIRAVYMSPQPGGQRRWPGHHSSAKDPAEGGEQRARGRLGNNHRSSSPSSS